MTGPQGNTYVACWLSGKLFSNTGVASFINYKSRTRGRTRRDVMHHLNKDSSHGVFMYNQALPHYHKNKMQNGAQGCTAIKSQEFRGRRGKSCLNPQNLGYCAQQEYPLAKNPTCVQRLRLSARTSTRVSLTHLYYSHSWRVVKLNQPRAAEYTEQVSRLSSYYINKIHERHVCFSVSRPGLSRELH